MICAHNIENRHSMHEQVLLRFNCGYILHTQSANMSLGLNSNYLHWIQKQAHIKN